MAARIRVYELARELGLTNKETLDLCAGLGIGVKSHSSSIEDAQADRVRRKAEREGLKRDVQPEEPAADDVEKAGEVADNTDEGNVAGLIDDGPTGEPPEAANLPDESPIATDVSEEQPE